MTRKKKKLARRVSLKIEDSLFKEIERLANEQDRSVNNMVRQLLKDAISWQKK